MSVKPSFSDNLNNLNKKSWFIAENMDQSSFYPRPDIKTHDWSPCFAPIKTTEFVKKTLGHIMQIDLLSCRPIKWENLMSKIYDISFISVIINKTVTTWYVPGSTSFVTNVSTYYCLFSWKAYKNTVLHFMANNYIPLSRWIW